MKKLYRSSLLLAFSLALCATTASAQGPRQAYTTAPSTVANKVEIKKIEGLGRTGRVKTPVYVLSPVETSSVVREWGSLRVYFATEADWTDELEFRYYVQVRNPKTDQDLLFTGTFTYLDIPKGNKHLSNVFLRPATLERHGNVIGVAVEIFSKGERVASASNPATPQGWWLRTSVKTVADVLLDRSQTPFAFVAYDNFIMLKPK